MIQLLVSVPETEHWRMTEDGWESSLPDDAIDTIIGTHGQFTSDPLFGSRTYSGLKIVNYVGESTLERVQAFVDAYNLDWTILAANTIDGEQLVKYDPAVLIEFMADVVAYNEDGQEISRTRPTEIGHIGRFAGMPDFEGEI